MDERTGKLKSLAGKYRYVFLVVIAGIFLMCLPGRQEKTDATASPIAETQSLQEDLEQILETIQGVGKVRVLLTQAVGERSEYIRDENYGGSGDTRQWDTVIITDENRAQKGLVSQVISPVYQGAVVVCQGGDSAAVRLAVVEAVCDATGLSADKISVLKMK